MRKSHKTPPLLQLVKVSKTYRLGGDETSHTPRHQPSQFPKVVALKSVSTAVHAGEFTAIIGPSGSGKSTLMHIMSLLDLPTQGSVIFQGTNTSSFSEDELARLRNRHLGFVFQQFNLLPRTPAIENVQLPLIYAGTPRKIRYQLAQDMLTKVGLGDRLRHTPAELSGGQQQRLAIARALINNPSVIFADEPTGNLDTQAGREIMQLLTQLHREGKTIILVTHELYLAKQASRIIHLKDGQIIADTHKN